MHALGVVSMNFANFERAITWVFAAVSKTSEQEARENHARVGVKNCIDMVEQASRARGWTGEAEKLVRHFVAAARCSTKTEIY
jgi:hypothetical protein